MLKAELLTISIFVCNILDALYMPDPPVFTAAEHYPCTCYLPPDSGLCSTSSEKNNRIVDKKEKLHISYYFDQVTEQCYPFGTQTCGGNENRFDDISSCQNFCRKR
ncbi:unnamed protein product [Thelazia callipaeda]|uniref:BPTI/Kunitz inhibitor domain-containing protein n=1 Tax=Thelazia callipaeda TaxID=103827 RepID=A0A0N5D6I3_THECL|nr:unnamed protein product [Thelazia callipaeda]